MSAGPDASPDPGAQSLDGHEAQDGPRKKEPRAPMRDLVPYLRPHWRVLLLVSVVSVLGAAVTLAQPALVAAVIGAVERSEPLTPFVLLLLALVLGGAVVSAVQQFLLQRTAEDVVRGTRRDLVHRLLRLPISEYDTRRTGDLVSRVGSDTTLLRSVVTSGLVEGLAGGLVFAGAVVAMALLDPVLLGLTLGVVAVATLVVVTLGSRIQGLSVTAQTQVGVLAAGVARAIPGIRTIRASRATHRETAALEALADDAYATGVRLAKVMALINPVIEVAMQGAFLLVLGVGGYRVATGAMTVADLVAFILYLFMMVFPLGSVFNAYTSVQNALGAVVRIQEITALPEEVDVVAASHQTAGTSRYAGRVAPAVAAGLPLVEFDHVSFGYGDRLVLREVSFTVPVGSRTALVGPSGAGKTTVLALVERFYDPTAGSIQLGGVDVTHLSRSEVRSWLGYVEQDAPVLAGTIRDNLLLASPDATDEDCERVLEQVRLTDILRRDPLGLTAPVGEDGILLSGGERQRLAIARTLLSSPRLLLLDEPTASLDGRNEQALREAVDAIAGNHTLMVVAHRLATVADADQIVVLDEGRVQAVGRHQELLGSSPLYRELAEHQLLV